MNKLKGLFTIVIGTIKEVYETRTLGGGVAVLELSSTAKATGKKQNKIACYFEDFNEFTPMPKVGDKVIYICKKERKDAYLVTAQANRIFR